MFFMKIQFLGTAAAEGVPAMFCSCKYCQDIKKSGTKEYRTRSQVVIDGELSIDFPPEAYVHSLDYGVDLSALKNLIVTHSHLDHFYAHDFVLRGYKYAELYTDILNIYGNDEVEKVYSECTRRELKNDVAAHLCFNKIKAFQSFYVGKYRVIALPAVHGTAEEALLYYVECGKKGYLHLYDTGTLSDESIDFLAKNGAKAQLAAFDCTFLDAPYEEGRRHMCIDGVSELVKKLKSVGVVDDNTIKVITHFSHNSNPTRSRVSEIAERYGFVGAYDGLNIEI